MFWKLAILATIASASALAWGLWRAQPEDRPSTHVSIDCEPCPEMVLIPAGTFHMGRQLRLRETLASWLAIGALPPLRTVDVEAFALSRTEVTISQWRACVAEQGCSARPLLHHANRDSDHPVTYVTWHDAQDYIRWISTKSRRQYRLPSEAEWEYAARAQTRTPFPWGRSADRTFANFGNEQCAPCSGASAGQDRWIQTAPVAQFPANSFGLHDMHGNVYEWTEDCFSGLKLERVTASAVLTEACSQRVIRGGAWHSDPRRIQSDYRGHNPAGHADDKIGFRVARTVP